MTNPLKAVFLSYARQDVDAAQRLCDALRGSGIEVWFDQNELGGGDAWDASIRRKIRECALFVPIVSANTEARSEGYFRREWNLAVNRMLDMADDQTFLLPAVIDATAEATARVPDRFRERQWSRLDSDGARDAFVARVLRLLELSAAAPAASPAMAPTFAGGTPSGPAPRRTNLPETLPPLFGRAQDLAEVQQLVREHPLVTVTGAGGIGKTQLARAVGLALRDEFADGVWWIELASVADPANVFASVAQTLGLNLQGTRPPQQVLADLLSNQRLLLVIDNCEHVLDRIAVLAEALLAGAAGVKLLATSQEPLKLPQERHYRLGTLAIAATSDLADAAHQGAVALFVERARAVAPKFALTEQNLGAVIDICRHLDGIPLAIELAAARVPLLGINALRDRLGERFRVLTGGSRFALRRHQTLHAALDWSHGLLSDPEQAVFRRMGIFAGGCTLEVAQHVAADNEIDAWAVLEHLGALVDKSMLVVHEGDAPRYTLLETSRAYALEKLAQAGETETVADGHLRAMLALFESMGEAQWAVPRWQLGERHAAELDNLRAALDWAARDGGNGESLVALTALSAPMWAGASRPEGIRRHQLAMSRLGKDTPRRDAARVLLNYALLAHPKSTSVELDAIERGIALCREIDDRLGLYLGLAMSVFRLALMGRLDEAQRAADEAESLRASVPLAAQAQLPSWRAHLHEARGEHDAATADKMEALRASERAGDVRGARVAQSNLADVQLARGNVDEAVRLGRDVVVQLRQTSLPSGIPFLNLSLALTRAGELDEALQISREAVPLLRREGRLNSCLEHCALLALKRGRDRAAARVLGRSRAVFAASGDTRETNEQRAYDDTLATLRQKLPADELERLMAEGAALDVDEAVRDALAE